MEHTPTEIITPEIDAEETVNPELSAKEAEIALLRKQLLEKDGKLDHLKHKYERDIIKPSAPVEIPEEAMSDEGKLLKGQIANLEKTLSSFQEKTTLSNVYATYPALKDKQDEFNEFRAEYPTMALDKLARVFVIEHGLSAPAPKRLGVEKPTGGAKAPTKQGMSIEDVARIRTTQPKLYQKMLKEGKINPDTIE